MNYIKGDLIKQALEGKFDVIVHGCNCFCTMGAGIAAGIKKEFPEAYRADMATVKGDKNKIGTYTQATVSRPHNPSLTIINAYTQYTYGRGKDLFEYEGFERILTQLKEEFPGKRFGLPLIGCGLAGGNQEVIVGMIEKMSEGEDVTIVEFVPG